MTRWSIQTPSRLHFGLLGWGPHAGRQFGGVGLMIQQPRLEIVAERAETWDFAGPLSSRLRALVHEVSGRWGSVPGLERPPAPARVQVVSAPPEHLGLGVGTQVSLGLVRLILELSGVSEPPLAVLAALSDRGRRSGIGLHGFIHGGLLVDGGHGDLGSLPPLVSRLPFPEDWSILIVQPPGPRGRHGASEVQGFSQLPPMPERVTEKLCRLVLLGVLPSVVERDLQSFGASLTELQRHVGAAFAPLQGGLYASRDSEELVTQLASMGLVGAGQSSWGPTLYAFGRLTDSERAEVRRRILDRWRLDPSAVLWTSAANRGALLSVRETREP